MKYPTAFGNLDLSRDEQNGTDGTSKNGQAARMVGPVRILKLEIENDDGLIVTFSDGTIGASVVEELLELWPYREPAKPSLRKMSGFKATPHRRTDR
jgi:hypothetical protein